MKDEEPLRPCSVLFDPWYVGKDTHSELISHYTRWRQDGERPRKADVSGGGLYVNPEVPGDDDDDDPPGDDAKKLPRIVSVPVFGSLAPVRERYLEFVGGTTTYGEIINKILVAVTLKAEGIVLTINSFGGLCEGLQELLNFIRYVDRNTVPVYGLASGRALSAGLAIGCSCRQFYATSFDVLIGGAGVISWSASRPAVDRDAREVQTSAPDKLTITDDSPEGDALRSEALEGVHEIFVRQLALYRGLTSDQQREIGSGKLYTALRAQELGLCDGVIDYATWLFERRLVATNNVIL